MSDPKPEAVSRKQSHTSSISKKSFDKAQRVSSNATATGEFGFPQGHIGHLTPEQEKALGDFKVLSQKEGLYTPATADKPASHYDAVLLRYLRARRFVPADALGQFKDTEQWRKTNELDSLYMNIDVEDFDQSRRHYPQWLGRRDKRGIPVYLFKVGALDSKTMSTYTKNTADIRMATDDTDTNKQSKDKNAKEKTPPRLLRLFALYENLAGFMTQLCTVLTDRPHPETPITQSNNIVDISGVGLKQFWNLRGHMQDASVLATAHYPETLDRIFIVGAPSFFPTVWSWIKRWFDPITVSKIFILSEAQAFHTLSQFIDPENIPKQYGGKLEFQFGDVATVDPAYGDRLTWKDDGASGVKTANAELRRWPKGPVQWAERDDGDWDLVAVGSNDGKKRRDVVATLKVGVDRGGMADPSLPRFTLHGQQTSNTNESITAAVTGAAAGAVTADTAVQHQKQAVVHPPQTSTEGMATQTSEAMSDPVAQPDYLPATSGNASTLLPIRVPGTAETSTNGQIKAKDAASTLPPASSMDQAIPPVPLAAVAEPLPGDGTKKEP